MQSNVKNKIETTDRCIHTLCMYIRTYISGAHMIAPPPLGQAEGDELHPRMDGGPPSAG